MAQEAWAVVMARSVDYNEALLGVTVVGRRAPVPSIERIAGPGYRNSPHSNESGL